MSSAVCALGQELLVGDLVNVAGRGPTWEVVAVDGPHCVHLENVAGGAARAWCRANLLEHLRSVPARHVERIERAPDTVPEDWA